MDFTDSISIVSFIPFLASVVQTVYALLHISETLTRKRRIFEHKFIGIIWSYGIHLPSTNPCNVYTYVNNPFTWRAQN